MYTYINAYIQFRFCPTTVFPLLQGLGRPQDINIQLYPTVLFGVSLHEKKPKLLDFSSAIRKGKYPGSHHPSKVFKCHINYTKTSWKTVHLRMTSNLDSSASSPQKCCNTSNASQLPLPQKKQGCLLFPTNPPWTGCLSLS